MSAWGFVHRDKVGQIEVTVLANDDPPSLGCDDENLMLPACTAFVRYPGGGYDCMLGWVQLVRSTDAETTGFEMDPNFLFPEVDAPYCYYGYLPTLFDCPGRSHKQDMDWVAHSFLAASPIEPDARVVTPLQGFSWGFSRRNRQVELLPSFRWSQPTGTATVVTCAPLTRAGSLHSARAGRSDTQDRRGLGERVPTRVIGARGVPRHGRADGRIVGGAVWRGLALREGEPVRGHGRIIG